MKLAAVINFNEKGVAHPVWEEREETPAEKAARTRAAKLLVDLFFQYYHPNGPLDSEKEER